jgi:hypothetical protein
MDAPVNDLLQIRPPKPIMPGVMLVIDLHKGFEMVLISAGTINGTLAGIG